MPAYFSRIKSSLLKASSGACPHNSVRTRDPRRETFALRARCDRERAHVVGQAAFPGRDEVRQAQVGPVWRLLRLLPQVMQYGHHAIAPLVGVGPEVVARG